VTHLVTIKAASPENFTKNWWIEGYHIL